MAVSAFDELTLRRRLAVRSDWKDLYELARGLYGLGQYRAALATSRELLNQKVPYESIRADILLHHARVLDACIGLDEAWKEHQDINAWRATHLADRSDRPDTPFKLLVEAIEVLRTVVELWPSEKRETKAIVYGFYAEHLELMGLTEEAAEARAHATRYAA